MKQLLSILLLVPILIFAQNNNYRTIDSLSHLAKKQKADTTLADIYNQISYNYIYQNADSGILYARRALAISKKVNWQCGTGNAFIQMGSHFTSKGAYDSSMHYLDKALEIFNAIHETYHLGKVYNQMGIVKANKGNYVEALKYFFKSLSLYENSTNANVESGLAGVFENIGTIYNFTGDHDKAVFYLEKGIAVLQKMKNRETKIALNFINIGTVYEKQTNRNKAIDFFKKADLLLKDQKDYFAIAFLNSSWATTYLNNGNYDLSIKKNELALAAATVSGDKELMTSIHQNLGYAQFKSGCTTSNAPLCDEGFKNLSMSLALYKDLKNLDGLRKTYLYLSEYYTYRNDFKNAFLMHQQYSNCNDSIYNLKNKQSLQNLEDQRTIELNKKEIDLNKLSLANKEKQKLIYLIAVLCLSCVGVSLFHQSSNRKKTNIQLRNLNQHLDEANKTKTRFFSILNHDLRSPVANLIHFLHLQKDSPEVLDEESKTRLEQKTIDGAENLLASMEDILLWSKGQMTNFKPMMKKNKVSDLFADTQKHFDSVDAVSIQFAHNDLEVITDENYLKTIIRNFTSNAIKALEHTPNGTIAWEAYRENDSMFLSVSDNGPGASSEQLKALYDDNEVVGIKTGLGLHLIRDLATAINVVITHMPNKGNGTTFTLRM